MSLTWLLLTLLLFSVNAVSQPNDADRNTLPLQLAQSDVSADVFLMVQQLQQEVRELRGQVEQLNHRVNQSAKQERDRYLDIDRRLLELSSGNQQSSPDNAVSTKPPQTAVVKPITGSPGQTSDSAGTITQVNEQAVREEYNKAYDLIKQRRYDEAVVALHSFVNKNPDSDLTPNAYYWLGEVYLVLPKLEQARQSFIVVVGKYPQHRKAADAMYKLGVTYHRIGNEAEAEFYLNQTIAKYPNTSAADLAKDYMARI